MLSKRECDSISLNSYKKQWFGVEVCRLRLGTYLNFVYYGSDDKILSYEVFYTENTFELRKSVPSDKETSYWKTIIPTDMISSPVNVNENEDILIRSMLGLDKLELALYDMSIKAASMDFIEDLEEQDLKDFLREEMAKFFNNSLYTE
ncbi:hypothetical protein BAU67_001879 [Escherichia coli]|nr:hypothetical protein [Escherichia coli]EMB7054120.1 hypothetical protein [Escherichia coli]